MYLDALRHACHRRGLTGTQYDHQLDTYLTVGGLSADIRRHLDGLAEISTGLIVTTLQRRYGPAAQLAWIAYTDRIGGV